LDAVHNALHIGLRGTNKSGNCPPKNAFVRKSRIFFTTIEILNLISKLPFENEKTVELAKSLPKT